MRAATRISVGVIGLLAMTSCSNSTSDTPPQTSSQPSVAVFQGPLTQGEGALNILAWPGYAENGSTDPAVDWVTPFEEETGCATNIKLVGSSDEAVKLVQGGGWDVVSLSGDSTLRLIQRGDVQPLNTQLLTNYGDLYPELVDQAWNSWGGQTYGIPHGRSANVLAYNTDDFSITPTSWSVVYEADSPVAGFVSAYDSPITIADAAVYLMARSPELGITNPYSLDADQFAAALDLLTRQRSVIGTYWIDPARHIADFTEGRTRASSSWSSVVNSLEATGVPVAGVKPSEGTTGWSDNWMVTKDAANITCAYLWLDWITSPKVNAQAVEYFGEAPSNTKACDFTADAEHCERYRASDPSYWNDVYFWNTPIEECLDGRTDVRCIPYEEWAQAWAQLRN